MRAASTRWSPSSPKRWLNAKKRFRLIQDRADSGSRTEPASVIQPRPGRRSSVLGVPGSGLSVKCPGRVAGGRPRSETTCPSSGPNAIAAGELKPVERREAAELPKPPALPAVRRPPAEREHHAQRLRGEEVVVDECAVVPVAAGDNARCQRRGNPDRLPGGERRVDRRRLEQQDLESGVP